MPVIGFLSTLSRGRPAWPLAAFRQALEGAGYVEGRNLAIEYRWAEGRYERLPEMAADLVHHNVAVIAATGGLVSAKAAKAVTATIPVLFIAGFDPVQEGLVASMSRPGGNATGVTVFSAELGRKRLQLLHELVGAGRIAMLVNPGAHLDRRRDPGPRGGGARANLEGAARGLNFQLLIVRAPTAISSRRSTRRSAGARARSLSAPIRSSPTAMSGSSSLLPATPCPRATRGRNMSRRRPDQLWHHPDLGLRADRRLCRPHPQGRKAGRPAGSMPSTFELAINLTTARSLDLTIPPNLLVLAQRSSNEHAPNTRLPGPADVVAAIA